MSMTNLARDDEHDFEVRPMPTPQAADACDPDALRERVRALLARKPSRYTLLLGQGDKMLEVRELIDRVADTDVTVLVRGESGTGKELVARAIHAGSLRRDKAFVKVNCAALPTELLESELFGFERGAFTGAIQQKPGKFEFANQGTMFLDEISEMPPPLQAKLLHVLQDGEFSRLGGRHDVRVDVRVVAATNRDLEGAVAEGLFREDLFFRLNVVCITLPPLRQRREEIPLLTEYFIQKYAEHYNRPPLRLDHDTLRLLVDHGWPGNVRELENMVKRMVVLGTDAPIRRELAHAIAQRQLVTGPIPALADARAVPVPVAAPIAAPAAGAPSTPSRGAAAEAVTFPAAPPRTDAASVEPPAPCSLKEIARHAAREAERELIARTLQYTRWNRREAAEILGISYKALLYKIKEADLDRAS
ncbi:MAG TPA: sigma-54 dependent transcriptional regulator [Vicinamibacterales bacterium]|nr:sigma-54 dependent transcriptional regulator [Vicinamibacterales bacterium]